MCGRLTHDAHLRRFLFGLACTSRLASSAARGGQATPCMSVFLVRMFMVLCTLAQYLVQLLSALLNAVIRAIFCVGYFGVFPEYSTESVCVCVSSIHCPNRIVFLLFSYS